jgi:hypothetical protein
LGAGRGVVEAGGVTCATDVVAEGAGAALLLLLVVQARLSMGSVRSGRTSK